MLLLEIVLGADKITARWPPRGENIGQIAKMKNNVWGYCPKV
jgi:hypothetical protein